MRINLFALIFIFAIDGNADQVTILPMNDGQNHSSTDKFEIIPKSEGSIDPEIRDELFYRLGIENQTNSMDTVDKNILFLRLKKLALPKLKELYPTMSEVALKKGREILGQSE